MLSFQSPFPELNQKPETNSKKRKYDDTHVEEILPYKHWKHFSNPKPAKSFSDIELHLETPLPSEWQRCLDIQSGEIHFYNSRTNKRTMRDPRVNSPEPPSPIDHSDHHHMSLDLELNLPCGSTTYEKPNPTIIKRRNSPPSATNFFLAAKKNSSSKFIMEEEDDGIEMVATVCVKCHMLVMLCKSSPTCPNCKFVHPPYQTSSHLFKPRLSSLSC